MPAPTISDLELTVVARVAGREAWHDLSSPPEPHAPRSLEEALAVARFRAAAPAPRRPRMTALRARLAVAALTVVVLGGCWIASPARTAIGLFGAGLFSLVALRRRRRPRPGARAAALR